MVDTVGTVYPFARLSEANKTIITSAVKRTGPIGGVCRVIHIVGSVWRWWLHKYTHQKFQNSPGTDLNVVLLSLLKSDAKVYQKVINQLYQKCCF